MNVNVSANVNFFVIFQNELSRGYRRRRFHIDVDCDERGDQYEGNYIHQTQRSLHAKLEAYKIFRLAAL